MPVYPEEGVGSGGGGVLGLGPVQNTFGDSSTADRTAAEALRDTYAGANAAWLTLYNNNNLSNWIRMVWSGGVVEQRRNAAGTGWEDVTLVIRGQPGDTGAQGRFRPGRVRQWYGDADHRGWRFLRFLHWCPDSHHRHYGVPNCPWRG